MEIQSLYGLVERIAGKENVSLIGPALECFAVQTEQALTEVTATIGTHRAVDFIEKELDLASDKIPLSHRRRLISEHLQGR